MIKMITASTRKIDNRESAVQEILEQLNPRERRSLIQSG
jgi:hypothetical protein